jgi:hypothetical protein
VSPPAPTDIMNRQCVGRIPELLHQLGRAHIRRLCRTPPRGDLVHGVTFKGAMNTDTQKAVLRPRERAPRTHQTRSSQASGAPRRGTAPAEAPCWPGRGRHREVSRCTPCRTAVKMHTLDETRGSPLRWNDLRNSISASCREMYLRRIRNVGEGQPGHQTPRGSRAAHTPVSRPPSRRLCRSPSPHQCWRGTSPASRLRTKCPVMYGWAVQLLATVPMPKTKKHTLQLREFCMR